MSSSGTRRDTLFYLPHIRAMKVYFLTQSSGGRVKNFAISIPWYGEHMIEISYPLVFCLTIYYFTQNNNR